MDIIVFPEGGLTAGRPPVGATPAEIRSALLPHSSFVPDPKDRVTPCKNDSSNVMQVNNSPIISSFDLLNSIESRPIVVPAKYLITERRQLTMFSSNR